MYHAHIARHEIVAMHSRRLVGDMRSQQFLSERKPCCTPTSLKITCNGWDASSFLQVAQCFTYDCHAKYGKHSLTWSLYLST